MNEVSEAEAILIRSFLADVSPGGQYGATKDNYKTLEFDIDKNSINKLLDPYLSVFNQGYRYSVVSDDISWNALDASNPNKENFMLPYQSLKGIYKLENTWRDNFVQRTTTSSSLYRNEFWRFPDFYGEIVGIQARAHSDEDFIKYLTNPTFALNKYFNYLDADNNIVAIPVEFNFINNNWSSDLLINIPGFSYASLFSLSLPIPVPVGSENTRIVNVPIKYLKDVYVFLQHWQPSFAYSLVKYHPEYHRLYLNPILNVIDVQLNALSSTIINDDESQIFTNPIGGVEEELYFTNVPPNVPTLQIRGIDGSYNNGFELVSESNNVFNTIYAGISSILRTQPLETVTALGNYIRSYSELTYLKENGSGFSNEKHTIWELFYATVNSFQNFCNSETLTFSGDRQQIVNNFPLLYSLYSKQLSALKTDLYFFYAKKANSNTLPCFRTSGNLNLQMAENSVFECKNYYIEDRVNGTSSIAKLNPRGNFDVSILDKELQGLAQCGSNPSLDLIGSAIGSGNEVYFEDLITLRTAHSESYCKDYLTKLMENLEFRT